MSKIKRNKKGQFIKGSGEGIERWKDIKGNKYNKLTAKKRLGKNKHNRSVWLCKCDCGGSTEVTTSNLTGNKVKSCGCLRGRSGGEKHGLVGSRIYVTWSNIKRRCTNKNSKYWSDYGGRGIKVCDRWKDFKNFLNDMYADYLDHCLEHGKSNTFIERVDNDDNHCPNNCKWATAKEQARNKRNNHILTCDGTRKTIAEWSEITGLNWTTIRQRLEYGWTERQAIKTPVGGNKNKT